jgi:hypothetical protein
MRPDNMNVLKETKLLLIKPFKYLRLPLEEVFCFDFQELKKQNKFISNSLKDNFLKK